MMRSIKLAGLAVVAAGALVGGLAPSASAYPPGFKTQDTVYTYYSGPDYSQVVGHDDFKGDCATSDGVETDYYTVQTVTCYVYPFS